MSGGEENEEELIIRFARRGKEGIKSTKGEGIERNHKIRSSRRKKQIEGRSRY